MPMLKEVVINFPEVADIEVQRTRNGLVFRSTEEFTVYSHPAVDSDGADASYPDTDTLNKEEILDALSTP